MTLNTYSTDEIESFIADTSDLPHDGRRTPILAHHPTAQGSDGIKAFMMNFTASASPETVAPATRDFLKAASFLFRK